MKKRYKIALGLLVFALIGGAVGTWYVMTADSREPAFVGWQANCAACHGQTLAGTDQGPSLIDGPLKYGDTVDEMMPVIAKGVPGAGKKGFEGTLSAREIKLMAIYISELRQRFPTTPASYTKEPKDPRTLRSQHHTFKLELVTALESRPYSIAPLPSGEILIAEKIRGLSLVDQKGTQKPLIEGTPEVWGTLASFRGIWLNLGTVLDVELHPNYAENGWIYLSHTHHCFWGCGWVVPGTMVRVVRGRIKEGEWVDQEVIWSVHKDHYTPVPDAVAAGRLAFDGEGFLYISIGGKNTYDKLHKLDTPFGKVHRVRDDGTVPEDNPFYAPPEKRPEASTKHTVWSYGHRTGQGLDGHPVNGEIWNTEMGPRGGDEINHILKGQNYGWPLYTNGLAYDGEEISIGKDLGLDFPIESTVLPVVDFTPAPAVSNFTFHRGDQFPAWKSDLLVGSLKASTLYRLRIEGGKLVEQEKLVEDFGRIRDVAMGVDGFVYVALEHNEAGSLWRLVPG
ncbi:MAG: PQQ-dependent sugar dehydrogenase [Pseudomonadota bacterium]